MPWGVVVMVFPFTQRQISLSMVGEIVSLNLTTAAHDGLAKMLPTVV